MLVIIIKLLHLRQWQKDKNKRRLTEHETLQLVYSEQNTQRYKYLYMWLIIQK